ncbi:MAG: glycerate kinase [Planctomycetes bacterium]|nr:glycerate kinase [Planctomycetota bacterium]
MNCLVAVDSFKGTASSIVAGEAIARGIRRASPDAETRVVAVADGGEGTVEAFLRGVGGTESAVSVHGPLMEERLASLLFLPDGTAVAEMASAAGLTLVPPACRNPLHATTFGVGELLRAALNGNCPGVFLGLGGSATVDGGIGAAAALGVAFLDESGKPLPPVGASLVRIRSIDASNLDPRITATAVHVLTDVQNPLLGDTGAARVFAPQKGADPVSVEILETGMANLARIVAGSLGRDCAGLPGTGSAGGLAYGLAAFLGASVEPGARAVLDAVGFDVPLEWSDVVVTGEGRLDGQSRHGKAPDAVLRRAHAAGRKVIAVAGSVAPDASGDYDAVLSLVDCVGEDRSFSDTAAALEEAVAGRWTDLLREGDLP